MNDDFSKTLSYNRFVELQSKVSLMLICFLKTCRLRGCTGASFVNSTKLCVCNNKRIPNHKFFCRYCPAWLPNFVITPSNADDREPLTSSHLLKEVMEKLVTDKSYISENNKITLRKRAIIESLLMN